MILRRTTATPATPARSGRPRTSRAAWPGWGCSRSCSGSSPSCWRCSTPAPLITFLLAVIALITGLRVFLPRVTPMDKVLIAIGSLASLVTLGILLSRIAS